MVDAGATRGGGGLMKKPKVVINQKGATALRNSPEMCAHLLQVADGMALRAGPGFVADVRKGITRAHGMVKSSDYASMKAQAEKSALSKAIRG